MFKYRPFVTIQNSHEFLTPYMSLANAASVKLLPLVKARQRMAWEAHVLENQKWVEEDLELRLAREARLIKAYEDGHGRRSLQDDEENHEDENALVSPYIKNYVGVDTSPRHWLPNWQYAPVIPNKWFINFNQLADEQFHREVVDSVLTLGKSVISKTQTFEPGLDFQSTKDFSFIQELLAAGGNGQYQPGEPIAYIHYPVFQSFAHQKDGDGNGSSSPSMTSPVVAVVSATVYWRSYLQNILPRGTNGIVAVIQNNEQAFTYIINGPEAVFQGMEDLHDPQYDSFMIETEYRAFERGTESARYSGVAVDDGSPFGAYVIRVYPSVVLEEDITTSDPWIYAVVVAVLMLTVVAVFVLYDWYVERRQRKVSSHADKSNAIITSLFPAKVRDQLFDLQESATGSPKKSTRIQNPLMPSLQRSNQLRGTGRHPHLIEDGEDVTRNPMVDREDDELNLYDGSLPIADFFPSCTVLFMDIAGT
jgi:hypothetical protein